jgi:hypothetical protein
MSTELPVKSYRHHAMRKEWTEGKVCYAKILNRKKGWVGVLNEKEDEKKKKTETADETFDRRMNEMHRSEEEWKLFTYEDYYRCKDKTKIIVFNQWEDNYLRVRGSLRRRRKRFHKKPYHWFVNEYNREMWELELVYGHPTYPWKPLQMI